MNSTAEMRDTVFVLFGAGGDLAQRLVVPALFNLHLDGLLPQRFALLGADRADTGAEALAARYRAGVEQHSRRRAPAEDKWRQFAAMIRYLRADVADTAAYWNLATTLAAMDKSWGSKADRIFYLAMPPALFEPVARGLGEAGLARERERVRVVVEKPLGHDLASFQAIDGALRQYFSEPQIFRMDHFLGKETVQNILAMRFANPMFEPLWNRRYIDHVAVTVAETLGVERRGGFYERAGALRDMVQNHLFQLLCLVAMEPPVAYDADDIRSRKADVLRALRPIPVAAVSECTVRGQYGAGWVRGARVPSYRAEPDVDPRSNTETFAALALYVDNWRWQGVPFYLRTGKRLAADVSEISIRFRDVPHHAFPATAGADAGPARLVIQIQPQEEIALKFTAKEPGMPLRLRPVDMRFNYRDAFRRESPAAYETLLRDVMAGDATLFMRADQVEAAWRVLMPVLERWAADPADDFPNYAGGSWGPEAAASLPARNGHSWLTPAPAAAPADRGAP